MDFTNSFFTKDHDTPGPVGSAHDSLGHLVRMPWIPWRTGRSVSGQTSTTPVRQHRSLRKLAERTLMLDHIKVFRQSGVQPPDKIPMTCAVPALRNLQVIGYRPDASYESIHR